MSEKVKIEAKSDVTEFEIRKGLNPYGFMHIPKAIRPNLPFEQGVPLKAKIEGETLVIKRAE